MPDADVTITITFNEDGNPVALNADASGVEESRQVHIGQSLRFISPHGLVRAVFKEDHFTTLMRTPFKNGDTAGDERPRVIGSTASGLHFTYKCAVTVGDKVHGWPHNQHGGGSVDVQPAR
jgi:hypothetical protein